MHNIETLDKLLKDELSATETYQQALNIHSGRCRTRRSGGFNANLRGS